MMDEIMDMSLDDYIKSFKRSKINTQNSIVQKEESKFKEGRREHNDIEAEEEEEDAIAIKCDEDDYVSLALNNDDLLEAKTEPNDLRNKIVGNLPTTSQQWRLMNPNIMSSRPAGMPPLVPSDAPQNGLSKPYWRNNRPRRWNNHNNYNNFNYNNNNHNNFRNNGRIQRFNNYNRPNFNSKNIKIVLEQLKQRNPMILYSSVGAPDLTIEATTQEDKKSNGFAMPPVVKSNFISEIAEPCDTTSVQQQESKGTEAIKSLLGVNEIGIRNDMIPSLAGKLLDFLNGTNSTVHKPIYDMKIQKEIHEIQKKPLLYKCPGGEVVSSDGIGIPDCKVQPKVSGISLNNRFA